VGGGHKHELLQMVPLESITAAEEFVCMLAMLKRHLLRGADLAMLMCN